MKRHFRTVIGCGQVGSRLASLYAEKNDILLTFNTDPRDSEGIKLGKDQIITKGGAGQNYAKGIKIWAENREKLVEYLEPVENQEVVYFVSGGGGSGSSSVITFLNILMRKNNKILLVVASPFLSESIPATSNCTRLLSRVSELSDNISVYVASNDEVAQKVGNSYQKINSEIVKNVKSMTDVVYSHENDSFTPFAIDEGDHSSVMFAGGFINVSTNDLEEEWEEKGPKLPKFSYGAVKEASNVLVVRNIHTKHNRDTAMLEGDKLLEIQKKIARSAKGARVIYGTIRTRDQHPRYITIASGLSIDRMFTKLKMKATDSAIKHMDKKNTKATKKLERNEDKLLNI